MPHPSYQRSRGRGRLVAKASGGRSRIADLFQEGAAKIRLPQTFSPEMEAVLINTSGGMTGGDRFDWSLEAGEGTFLTATTQACEKIYKAAHDTAAIDLHLKAGPGARLHWLPQESILFDRASLTRRLEVDLATDAEFIGVEAVLLGRKAMGESVTTGLLRDRWRVRREGRLIHAEELRLDGEIATLGATMPVLGGALAFATVLYAGDRSEALLGPVRAALGDAHGGASEWDGKLLVRLVAADGFGLRKKLIPVISALRGGASVPKVWNL
nr:urease accessory protein UreD [Rhizobium halophytocola]